MPAPLTAEEQAKQEAKDKLLKIKAEFERLSILNLLSDEVDRNGAFLTIHAGAGGTEACDWCNIPFEVNAFTKTSDSWSGISITITEKAFEDSFENSKPYFAINDSDLIGGLQSHITIPTFHGNSEEVNIYYIGEKFKRVKHKTKLMFVLCDGMTTGSRNELREVITRLEADYGIIVVGIGVLDNGVIGTYHHTKVFNTMEELETELAPYLIDTLGKYAV